MYISRHPIPPLLSGDDHLPPRPPWSGLRRPVLAVTLGVPLALVAVLARPAVACGWESDAACDDTGQGVLSCPP